MRRHETISLVKTVVFSLLTYYIYIYEVEKQYPLLKSAQCDTEHLYYYIQEKTTTLFCNLKFLAMQSSGKLLQIYCFYIFI